MANVIEKIIAVLIAFIFLFPGGYKLYSFLSFKQQSVLLSGTVVKQGMGQYLGCKPFIEFYDGDGIKFEMKSEVNYYFFSCPKIGHNIKILHNKSTPSKNLTVSIMHYLIIPAIMICIGLLTIYMIFLNRKEYLTKRENIIRS